jgi:hypothetical protein
LTRRDVALALEEAERAMRMERWSVGMKIIHDEGTKARRFQIIRIPELVLSRLVVK